MLNSLPFSLPITNISPLSILIQIINPIIVTMSQSLPRVPSGGGTNFTSLSKQIESNRIQVSFIQESMRKEVERNRLAFRFPASIAQGELHRHAAKFGFRKDLKGEIPIVCPCCRLRMDNQPISVCYGTSDSTIQMEHNYEEFKLTPGVAVFFSILKATLVYVLILSLCAGYGFYFKDLCQILDLYPSWEYYRCPNPDPNPIPTSTPPGVILFVDILFLVGVVLSMVFFLIYRKGKHAWHREVYSKNQTEEAYTVLVSNIPVLDFPKKGEGRNKSEFFYRKHLEDYLEERVRTWVEGSDSWQKEGGDSNQKDYLQVLGRNEGELKSKAIVKSISLCYNLSKLEIIDDTRSALIQQQEMEDEGTALIDDQNAPHSHPSESLSKDHPEEDRFSTLPKKIEFINDCRIVLNNQYSSDNSFLFNLTHFVGHAFVSFQYQHYRNFFLQEYEKDPKRFIYNGSLLKFAPAAGPGEVNWKNLRVGVQEKERLQLNSYFVILLVLLIQFGVLFGLGLLLYRVQAWKELLKVGDVMGTSPNKGDRPYVFAIIASLIIASTNELLKKVIKTLVSAQRHKTRINQTTSHMNKSVLSQTLSACLSLFLLDTLIGMHGDLHFYGNTFIAISSGLEILYQLMQPGWVYRQVRRWWRYRGRGTEDTVGKFQCQLNKEFQLPQYELSYRYSYFIYKTYVGTFFAFTAPLGLFITLGTLAIMYWLDKFNLFTRSSLYFGGNLSISSHALRMLQFSLLILAGATFFFGSQGEGGINIPALCGLGVVFFYLLLILAAPSSLSRVIFGREVASDKFIYDDCVGDGKFSETYWSRNPATMLVEEESVTGKQMVTNPALMRRFARGEDYGEILGGV